MSKFFLTITVFAMIVSVTITVAHACVKTDFSDKSSIFQQLDDVDKSDISKNGKSCYMNCSGCCVHHVMVSNNLYIDFGYDMVAFTMDSKILPLSYHNYGLKRPPKTLV